MAFGDMEWARSGGRLSRAERIGQIWEIVRLRITQRLRARPKTFGARSPEEVDRMMREVELPASDLVERAASLVARLGPDALTGHALRTFAWGALLGMRDGLSWDSETFALAALLHDLALARRTSDVSCFAADGAVQASALLEEWGAPEELRWRVCDAICMHGRVAVPPNLGVEAHLVHGGAGVDAIGRGLSGIDPELRNRILARHPRGQLKAFLVDVFLREAREHPKSRMGLWVSFGFTDRILQAPFSS
jgi:hypothetical protein